jgi:nicotinamidase-related amidase
VDPLKRLFTFAVRSQVPIISTRLHHLVAPGQRGNNRVVCTPGTPGHSKMPYTTLRRRTEWPLDCGTSLPPDGFRVQQQFIFDLPSLNLFECPRLDRLLSESTVEVFLLVGAPLEWTVRTAVLGLLARRHKIAVISDCIGMWDPYEGDMALRQIESKNVEWMTAEQAAERFGPVARSRASRELRARSRATQGNVPTKAAPSKSPRGAFRI